MFEDVEDEFELDIINQRESDDEEEKKSATRRRLSRKMNFSQVIYIYLCDYNPAKSSTCDFSHIVSNENERG
jgi:hypothetical protein